MLQPIGIAIYILLLLFYIGGPLSVLWVQSPRGIFWLTYGTIGIQVIAGLIWLATLIIELVFASEGGKSSGLSESTQRLFGLLFFVATLSIAIPALLGFAMHFEKIPQSFRGVALVLAAVFPLITTLPGHPVTSLAGELWRTVKYSIESSGYRDSQRKRLKGHAERLRQDFDSGKGELACEWFANDPMASPEKFVACRTLIEGLTDSDKRMQQINFFRPTQREFGVWFADQKNFSSDIRDWGSGTAIVPEKDHAWLVRTLLTTLLGVSDPMFRED